MHGPEQIADLPVPVAESPSAVHIGHPERDHFFSISHPIRCSTRCLANVRARISGVEEWKYLYRAVDKVGDTFDFLLTAKRDIKAALRFLRQAIRNSGTPE